MKSAYAGVFLPTRGWSCSLGLLLLTAVCCEDPVQGNAGTTGISDSTAASDVLPGGADVVAQLDATDQSSSAKEDGTLVADGTQVADGTAPADVTKEDGTLVAEDGAGAKEDGAKEDGTLVADGTVADGISDASNGPPSCVESHTFSFKAPANTQDVVVAGNWQGWNADVGEPLLDGDGDGTWTATVVLGAGAWQYKFVADGKWLTDPSNPDQIDDGFGGNNSVVVVPKCAAPIGFTAVQADHAIGSLKATFKSGVGSLKADKVEVSVDLKPLAAGCKAVDASSCEVSITNLPKGIHDVRVTYGGHTVLLKVYSGITTDWRAAPMYFAMTDRFTNGDTNNDAPVGGMPKSLDFNGGDFVGITKKIDAGYFSDLGIGALWISWPAKQFAGAEPGGHINQGGCNINPKGAQYKDTKYTAYHGYWPVSLTEVEPRFGTLKDLQDMVNAAHTKGIRVLLDFTANHVHTAAPLFAEKKDHGWFHTPAEVCQDVGWDNKPVTCWFTKYLADFNYSNPATRNAVIDSAVDWVKSTGADGFRLDAVKHIEMAFVEQLRARTDGEFATTGVDFYIVGETFTGDAQAIKTFVADDRIHAQFDFPTNLQVLKAFAKEETDLKALDGTVRGIKGVYGKHSAWMSTFLGNHDIARFFSIANGDVKCGIWDIVSNQALGWTNPPPTTQPTSDVAYRKLLLAFVYVYSVPGIPLIYYGDEYGMAGAGDPDNRRFWQQPTDHGADLLAAMKVLGGLRQSLLPLQSGAWPQPLVNEANLHVLARTVGQGADRQAVVVAINRGASAQKGTVDLKKAGVTKLKAGSKCTVTQIDKTGAVSACAISAELNLSYDVGARSAVVFALNGG